MNKRYRLSSLDLDEISLVRRGDDPTAKTLIHKAAGCDHTGMKSGATCPECGAMIKGMPSGSDLYVEEALQARRKKKRKQLVEKARKIRDGDGDGFYSPARGMPDKTPVPPNLRAMSRMATGQGAVTSVRRGKRPMPDSRLEPTSRWGSALRDESAAELAAIGRKETRRRGGVPVLITDKDIAHAKDLGFHPADRSSMTAREADKMDREWHNIVVGLKVTRQFRSGRGGNGRPPARPKRS